MYGYSFPWKINSAFTLTFVGFISDFNDLLFLELLFLLKKIDQCLDKNYDSEPMAVTGKGRYDQSFI